MLSPSAFAKIIPRKIHQKGVTLTIWQSPSRRGYFMSQYVRPLLNRSFLLSAFAVVLASSFSSAQSGKTHPWSNANLSPDERASMVVKEMTLDEKILLLHGNGMPGLSPMSPLAVHSNGGARYASRIQRLRIPAIQMSDAADGVRMSGENGRYS